MGAVCTVILEGQCEIQSAQCTIERCEVFRVMLHGQFDSVTCKVSSVELIVFCGQFVSYSGRSFNLQ